jgi:hypothetical protein
MLDVGENIGKISIFLGKTSVKNQLIRTKNKQTRFYKKLLFLTKKHRKSLFLAKKLTQICIP